MFMSDNLPANTAETSAATPPTPKLDPRRMMWAGLLVDSANLIGGGQMQGLAGQWSSQAMMMNHKQELDTLSRQRQAEQDALAQQNKQRELDQQLLTNDMKEFNAAVVHGFRGGFDDWLRVGKDAAGEGPIGKVNPGLYTPESVAEFEKTEDYSVLQRRPMEPTAEMRNFNQWLEQNQGKDLNDWYSERASQKAEGSA